MVRAMGVEGQGRANLLVSFWPVSIYKYFLNFTLQDLLKSFFRSIYFVDQLAAIFLPHLTKKNNT